MIKFQPVFSTLIWMEESCIDNDSLLKECYKHRETTSTNHFSNIGGYQGDDFGNKELENFIIKNIPKSKFNKIRSAETYSWVNINPKGSRNYRHHHFTLNKNHLFAGVYYVKVPENSGSIIFHDPRGSLIHTSMDMKYLLGASPPVYEVKPKAGECYYFPTWLEHEVTENLSEEDRISIAFNLYIDNQSVSSIFKNQQLLSTS
tara:strand:- start:40 stop:648 length:609 start_codon:yes stop_codon:yes gene_type:complete